MAEKEPRPGRKAFAKLGPKGVRIRMMEPGEAGALEAILRTGPMPAGAQAAFVPWLLRREVFVAFDEGSAEPLGFAAARALEEVYWLSALAVLPAQRRRGVGRALAKGVAARAGWFFHRAVALAAFPNVAGVRPFFEACGYMTVSRNDLPAMLCDEMAEDLPAEADDREPIAMVRWL